VVKVNTIEIKKLTKEFGDMKAVDSADLEIRKGELFGLLGPNGAGKTTLISMLSTILNPTTGSASVCGFDINNEKGSVRKCIGIVFQDPSLDFELTGRENMDFHGRLYRMGKSLRSERIEEVLRLVELEDKADTIVKEYSGGMKRRLEIARGLMHRPMVLFLDEPTIGLDPQTRRNIWDYIKILNKKEDITIILTTHYMEEADYLCDRVAIIDHGKIIALGTTEELKNIIGGDVISLESDNNKKLGRILKGHKCVEKESIVDGRIDLCIRNGDKMIPKILTLAQKNKITIHSVNLKKPSLEDVFIYYTGRTIRDEKSDSKDFMRQRMKMRGH
jgi:ABC-2 type transport system ATP-binding protein